MTPEDLRDSVTPAPAESLLAQDQIVPDRRPYDGIVDVSGGSNASRVE